MTSAQPRYDYEKKTRQTLDAASRFGYPNRWIVRLLHRAVSEIGQSDLLPSGGSLLDYGCGERPYQDIFARRFSSVVGADFPGNPAADFTVGPRGEMPSVADETFDAVLSTQVLEHVVDPCLYLAEARRVLKPGGVLILSTHGMFQHHADPNDYWRWTRTGLELEVSRAGFEVVDTRSIFRLPSVAVQFWQYSTVYYVPPFLRKLYIEFHQGFIGLLERIPSRKGKVIEDACIHIVIARNPPGR
ncbi:MAG TPA: class I SAM-dependent methyltransferase [Sedimentisphaerales bacterium]|nr:class I SAM-dependent methyltransferase [Sedimentisphaerales bacterium]